jgi:hypothetical protein
MLLQVNALPSVGPSHELLVSAALLLVSGTSAALQLVTGETDAGTLPVQAQCALQQSQYRVA